MTAARTTARPVLADDAVYWADNGCRICIRCAGASALYTGRDLSGQRVERVTVEDVHGWPADLGPLGCEAGCTTLSPIAGPDGWPLATTTSAATAPGPARCAATTATGISTGPAAGVRR